MGLETAMRCQRTSFLATATAVLLPLLLMHACAKPEVVSHPKRIRVAYTASVDISDIPSLMAHDRLAGQGYEIVTTFFAQNELAVDTLARGDVDLGIGSVSTFWMAAGKGAPIATVVEQVADNWMLVARKGIDDCAGLNGKRMGHHTEGAVGKVLVDHFLRSNCAGIRTNNVMISGSENRAAALLSGAIDASPLQVADVMRLDRLAAGRFHVLVDFWSDLPGIKTTAVHANRRFMAAHPQAVRDYIRELLTVHRRIAADPSILGTKASQVLKVEKEWALEVGRTYVDKGMWDCNGGLTPTNLASTLAFFTLAGRLPAGLKVSDVADLSFLNSVLEEIGRK
jgi:NitT/TauT family transport system substrate-binding protein